MVSQVSLGAAGIFVRLAMLTSGPMTITCLRTLFAALVVFSIACFRKRLLAMDRENTIRLVSGGFALGIHFMLWSASLIYLSVALSTLLVCTTPFFLAIIEASIERRLPAGRVLLAIPLAAASTMYMVTHQTSSAAAIQGHTIYGAFLALLAAGAIGFYLTVLRPVQTRFRTLSIIAYTYPSAAFCVLPVALYVHQPIPSSAQSWIGLACLAIVTQLMGHTALAASLRFFKPSVVGFVSLVEPAIASIVAAIVLGEAVSAEVLIGGAVLLIAIGMILSAQESPTPEFTLP
jgi:drug/metabolite transporter (DMT)-like permease